MINGLRLKNALLCQTGEGKKYCKHCSYNNDDKCDIKKLSSDVLEYIKTGEDTFNMLQDELLKHMKVSEGDFQIERINKHNSFFVPKEEEPTYKWIIDGHHIICEHCGMCMCRTDREGDTIPHNFCPECGVRMEEIIEG